RLRWESGHRLALRRRDMSCSDSAFRRVFCFWRLSPSAPSCSWRARCQKPKETTPADFFLTPDPATMAIGAEPTPMFDPKNFDFFAAGRKAVADLELRRKLE